MKILDRSTLEQLPKSKLQSYLKNLIQIHESGKVDTHFGSMMSLKTHYDLTKSVLKEREGDF